GLAVGRAVDVGSSRKAGRRRHGVGDGQGHRRERICRLARSRSGGGVVWGCGGGDVEPVGVEWFFARGWGVSELQVQGEGGEGGRGAARDDERNRVAL